LGLIRRIALIAPKSRAIGPLVEHKLSPVGCATRRAPLIAFVALAIALAGCGGNGAQGPAEMPPAPVLVAKTVRKTVPVVIKEIGTVEAYASIAVKARVEGNLVAIHFKEGDYVRKGQPLFTIDPRPYQAALKQAEANLAADRAKATQAHADEERYKFLLQEEVGSRQQFDQAYATSASLAAAVAADEAAVQSARLNLEYTDIRSPIDGRTGSLQNHVGDLIKADADTPMVTIDQVQPIYVDFSIPESDLAEVRAAMEMRQLVVEAEIPGAHDAPERGVLAFIDNSVDKTTGTIALKGLFQNDNRSLWPGEFVNATLVLRELNDAVLAPTAALQTGQHGVFVYVVGPDLKASPRPVVAGPQIGDETVIEHGLEGGETVVTDGQIRLMPGAKVRIKQSLDASGKAQ